MASHIIGFGVLLIVLFGVALVLRGFGVLVSNTHTFI